MDHQGVYAFFALSLDKRVWTTPPSMLAFAIAFRIDMYEIALNGIMDRQDDGYIQVRSLDLKGWTLPLSMRPFTVAFRIEIASVLGMCNQKFYAQSKQSVT